MAKLLVGFILAVIFIVITILMIHSIRAESAKKKRGYIKNIRNKNDAKDNFLSVKDGLAYLQSIKGYPVYGQISQQIDSMLERLTGISALVDKHPEYIDSLKDLEYYVIPLMKKLLCNYETYIKVDIQEGKNIQEGLETIKQGLQSIITIFSRCIDTSMQNNTLDLNAEISVLQQLYAPSKN